MVIHKRKKRHWCMWCDRKQVLFLYSTGTSGNRKGYYQCNACNMHYECKVEELQTTYPIELLESFKEIKREQEKVHPPEVELKHGKKKI